MPITKLIQNHHKKQLKQRAQNFSAWVLYLLLVIKSMEACWFPQCSAIHHVKLSLLLYKSTVINYWTLIMLLNLLVICTGRMQYHAQWCSGRIQNHAQWCTTRRAYSIMHTFIIINSLSIICHLNYFGSIFISLFWYWYQIMIIFNEVRNQ